VLGACPPFEIRRPGFRGHRAVPSFSNIPTHTPHFPQNHWNDHVGTMEMAERHG